MGGVSKSFIVGKRHVDALSAVDVDVRDARITGLIGPDGAGKTTLLRLAVGLLVPDSGRIETLGLDIGAHAQQVQGQVGYMPQRFGLYEDLSVQENLDLYADLHGVTRAERTRQYEPLLHMTGLAPFTARLAGRLSGGMKQKLGLACTLLSRPQLLLLDEPTVGVDPVSRRELWSIVQQLVEERGTSVLLSTAYLDEAERCHEVILLHQGRVLGRGSPSDFSAGLEGHTFMARSKSATKRELQARLLGLDAVADAVVQGERVRVVLDPRRGAAQAALAGQIGDAELEPVAPRFEDGFIVALRTTAHGPSAPLADAAAPDAASAAYGAADFADSAVISADRLTRKFGSFYAVRNLSFEVRRGEVFGLLGANGAGKTTTFRMLCGLLPPTSGRLTVAGADLRHAAAAARTRIGYMSQKFSLYGALSVGENLDFFSSAYGLGGHRRRRRVQWAFDQFALGPVKDTPSRDLSLGYKQRLALACALMHEPAILFLDEPTSGVDPIARREFWLRINELARAGVTVMVTTHFMEEAEYCDRLAIMANGELLALDSPLAIRRRARSESMPDPNMEDAFIALLSRQDPP